MRFYIKTITAAILLIGLSQAAHATCGVNGYWGSECGPQTPAPTTPGGDITNTLTGGNASTGPVNVTTGPTTATGGQGGAGGSVGDTTATSGSTSTATGGSSVAGVTGSGNSSSSSTSGVSGSGNSTNSTTVNNTNKTRIKHAASTAAPALIQNTGNTLCDGGGSFSASVQTFGWGISAANKKGDRFCQLLATFGPQVAGAYIAEKDNAAKRAMLNNGAAITSRQAASPDARAVVRCPASHPNLRDVRGELRCYRSRR